MADPAPAVRIGTSGWSYPQGRGTWNGVFYPVAPGSRSPRGFDELAYYAEHFDTVEVNSTFYRVPSAATTASWVRRTPPGFEFAVKLHQQFTHPAMHARSTGDLSGTVTLADADAFKFALAPLADAGRLGPLLVQFPPSFTNDGAAQQYLAWLFDVFRDYTLALELRHRTWSDAPDDTRALLAAHDAAWVQIDEPKFKTSIRQDLRPAVGGVFYLRMHGRNAAQWWDHDASEDRYNYLYTSDELEPFAARIEEARRLAKKIYLYMNNHFEAKAVANAAMITDRLGLDVRGTYPDGFLERYPELRGRVTPASRQSLF